MTDPWFVTRQPRPPAPARLLCLPYAGGGTAVYAAWGAALGPSVEVTAVALPGRERRVAEHPEVRPSLIAAAVAAHTDRPYALFGHSMGALVAFEVARELRRIGATLPVRLYVSGSLAPDAARGDAVFGGLSHLDDTTMLDRLVLGGGLPVELTQEPELLELLLPIFRADLGWLDDYRHTEEAPLPVPVTAFAGADDASAPPQAMDDWRRQTTGGFALHELPGGHFFLDDNLPVLGEIIRGGLLAPVR